MAEANRITLKVNADTKAAESRLKKFQGSAKKTGLALSAMGGIGILAVKGFVGAALEQQQSMDLFLTSAKNSGASMEGLRQRVMEATGALQNKTNYGDEGQLKVLAKMIPILGSVDKALAALPLVLDASAASGKNMESVAETLTASLAGQTNTAKSLGTKFDATATFAERLALGFEKVGGSAESQRDPMIQMSNSMGDLKEKIGDVLLPVIVPLVDKLTQFINKIQTLNPNFIKFIGITLLAATALGTIAGPMMLVIAIVPKLVAVIKVLRTAQLALNMAIALNPAVAIFMVIAAALVIFAVAWHNNFGGIRDFVRKVMVAIGDFIAKTINKGIELIQKLAKNFSFLLPQSVEDSIASIKKFEINAGAAFDKMAAKGDTFAAKFGGLFGQQTNIQRSVATQSAASTKATGLSGPGAGGGGNIIVNANTIVSERDFEELLQKASQRADNLAGRPPLN
jgi:uncharacterized protein with PQ loop repeat